MFLHRSNRAEVLVTKLVEVVADPVGGPFEGECIAVQGKGMERWLTMELAKRHGVWANPDFPFARGVIERAFKAVLPEGQQGSWDSAALLWAAAKGLLAMQERSGFEPIRAYLDGDMDHRKLLQLASKVAELFDGYAVYRPELLKEWQERGGSEWQAQLWQGLSRKHRFTHVGTSESDFMAALSANSGPLPGFPRRVSLFGISALPPLYLRVLAALAGRIDVHLFLLSPSQEYWTDIRSRREVLREELKDEGEELEVGNELLATLGRLHRDFQYLLERDVNYVDLTEEYQEPDEGTVLGILQSDILHLRDRTEADEAPEVSASDQSLAVHSCHGPTRELEVLRDQLIARLDTDPTLEARDIIVMTPDIESYAPFIQAVFSEKLDGGEEILPFHIADRAPRAAYPVVEAFARLLDVVPGRLTGPDLLDFLSIDVVRERFSIAAEELPTIHTWVAATNIRWGSDASHRAALGQPASELNTWRFGLQRLLLGYAAPSNGSDLFAKTLAFDDIEGGVADLLGRFADFCESIFALQSALGGRHSMREWAPILERALASILRSDDDCASEHQSLRESFAQLGEYATRYGFDEPLSLGALVPILDRTWSDRGTRSNFLSGGISFCQLMPMRSIPHRVVCIIGMNDGVFPKNIADVSFDLVAGHPRLGDRRPRDDDRYLFLEALLSARDALLITYTGQNNQTNAPLPASVLVEQLVAVAKQSTSQDVLVRHPLHSFSPRYFEEEEARLYRYSHRDCLAAQTLVQRRSPPPPFVGAPITVPEKADGEIRTVEIGEFVSFFTQNSRYFLSRRVGLRLRDDQEELAQREPMELAGLENWFVGDTLLRSVLERGNAELAKDILRASGTLPLGTPGAHHLESELPLIEALVNLVRPYRREPALDKLEVDFTLGKTRIVGHLGSLWPAARQEVSYSTFSGKREVRAWLGHLILCHQATGDYPKETIAIGRKNHKAAGIRLRPVEDPASFLAPLLELFELGQTVPVPFFPQTSREFARHWTNARKKEATPSTEASLAKASATFRGGNFRGAAPAEGTDAYVRQIYGAQDPTNPAFRLFEDVPLPPFTEVAMTVYGPLLEHEEPL